MSVEILTIARIKCSINRDMFFIGELLGCHTKGMLDNFHTVENVRNELERMGWLVNDDGEFCPHCRKLLEDKKESSSTEPTMAGAWELDGPPERLTKEEQQL